MKDQCNAEYEEILSKIIFFGMFTCFDCLAVLYKVVEGLWYFIFVLPYSCCIKFKYSNILSYNLWKQVIFYKKEPIKISLAMTVFEPTSQETVVL